MNPVRIFFIAAPLLLGGCASLSFTTQAVMGQLDILGRSRPIAELLDDSPSADATAPATPLSPETRARLANVLRMRTFATQELKLPDNGSYTTYAELDRPAVAWNVIATPTLSLKPREWCYPFSGCVPYRGYFARERALREARLLKAEGLDVRVAAVSAYSTLGWFRDPVFNTQLRQDDAILAGVIFHELAHQQLYLPGDATFNESFATTVEIEGLHRWLAQENHPPAAETARAELARRHEFVELVLPYRQRLEALYASAASEPDKLAAKAKIFAELKAAWPALQARWGGEHGYAWWFAQELNNAHLTSVGLYHEHVPAFTRLLREHGGNFAAFYRAARTISKLPAEERRARLEALTSTARN